MLEDAGGLVAGESRSRVGDNEALGRFRDRDHAAFGVGDGVLHEVVGDGAEHDGRVGAGALGLAAKHEREALFGRERLPGVGDGLENARSGVGFGARRLVREAGEGEKERHQLAHVARRARDALDLLRLGGREGRH